MTLPSATDPELSPAAKGRSLVVALLWWVVAAALFLVGIVYWALAELCETDCPPDGDVALWAGVPAALTFGPLWAGVLRLFRWMGRPADRTRAGAIAAALALYAVGVYAALRWLSARDAVGDPWMLLIMAAVLWFAAGVELVRRAASPSAGAL